MFGFHIFTISRKQSCSASRLPPPTGSVPPPATVTSAALSPPQVTSLPAGWTGPVSVVMTSPDGAEERLACDGAPPPLPSGGAFSSDTSAAAGSLLNQELDNIWQLGEMEPDNKCKAQVAW